MTGSWRDRRVCTFRQQSHRGANSKSHIAMGASEEIATSVCALATVGMDVEILEDTIDGSIELS
jgi:hypothetical protein